MKTLIVSIVTTLGFIAGTGAFAKAPPAAAPAGTTGQCKDGTWYSGASKKGACHGHKGLKTWYGGAESASAPSSSAKSTTAAATESTAHKSSTKKKKSESASAKPAVATAATGARPANATGLCKDGSYYSGASKKGACHGHKGLETWYGAASATSGKAASSTASTMPSRTAAPAAPETPAAMPAPKSETHASMPSATSRAAGGGAGKVWVNSESKVYHCPGDRYYGATKKGEYMSEADAIAKGNRAAHGKACSS